MSGVELLLGSAGWAVPSAGFVSAPTAGLIGTGGAFSATTALGTGLSVLSAGSSIVSGISQAQTATENAKKAEAEAAFNAEQQRRKTQSILASQRAQFGASGAVATEGSPVEVLAATASEGELDALSILYGGKTESNAYRSKASSAVSSGIFGASSSLLSTGKSLLRNG